MVLSAKFVMARLKASEQNELNEAEVRVDKLLEKYEGVEFLIDAEILGKSQRVQSATKEKYQAAGWIVEYASVKLNDYGSYRFTHAEGACSKVPATARRKKQANLTPYLHTKETFYYIPPRLQMLKYCTTCAQKRDTHREFEYLRSAEATEDVACCACRSVLITMTEKK